MLKELQRGFSFISSNIFYAGTDQLRRPLNVVNMNGEPILSNPELLSEEEYTPLEDRLDLVRVLGLHGLAILKTGVIAGSTISAFSFIAQTTGFLSVGNFDAVGIIVQKNIPTVLGEAGVFAILDMAQRRLADWIKPSTGPLAVLKPGNVISMADYRLSMINGNPPFGTEPSA